MRTHTCFPRDYTSGGPRLKRGSGLASIRGDHGDAPSSPALTLANLACSGISTDALRGTLRSSVLGARTGTSGSNDAQVWESEFAKRLMGVAEGTIPSLSLLLPEGGEGPGEEEPENRPRGVFIARARATWGVFKAGRRQVPLLSKGRWGMLETTEAGVGFLLLSTSASV